MLQPDADWEVISCWPALNTNSVQFDPRLQIGAIGFVAQVQVDRQAWLGRGGALSSLLGAIGFLRC